MDPNRELNLLLIEGVPNIDGRFTGIQRLGRAGGDGQFSLMFRAVDTARHQPVAVKVYDHRHADPYRLASFEREAQILGQLAGSRDIIELVHLRSEITVSLPMGAGKNYALTFPYYAMELARESVADIIAREGWTAVEILEAFRTMCRAVQRIHSLNIAHRDLKPDNFLVMTDGSVKLSDFGTARSFERSASPLVPSYIAPPGDLLYTAPEMLALLHDEAPAIAYWADVYALGAILFELFTGTKLGLRILHRPFQGQLIQLMQQVPRGQRRSVYDGFVRSIVARYPLPTISQITPNLPGCIRQEVDRLYRSLAALDYRERLRSFGFGFDRHKPVAQQLAQLRRPDFGDIFRQIEVCLRNLRQRQAYERMRTVRQRQHPAVLAQ